MLVSTKGRYAIRVLIDLAEHYSDSFVSLQDISLRQDISRKYLESIMTTLVKNKLLLSGHGKGGGYKLVKPADQYKILDILKITEDSLAPVSCLKESNNDCARCNICKTLPMWKEVNKLIEDYFNNKTIQDLITSDPSNNYII